MFGYVRVYKDDLRVREYETYRGIYCSLCKALGKRYGVFSRLILSYDMTFLAMVRLSLAQVVPSFKPGRCPFNPSKKCNYCMNAEAQMDFVCAAAILMFYYKVKDNIADAPFGKRILYRLMLPFAAVKRKKALRRFSWMDTLLADAVKQQAALEQSGTDSFDKAAHSSADALGKIMAYETGDREDAVYRLGYFVGRWVYLMDAADDLPKDLKTGNFNVFVNAFHLTDAALNEAQTDAVFSTLNGSCACAADALKNSELTILQPILENIIYDGTASMMGRLRKGSESHERSV